MQEIKPIGEALVARAKKGDIPAIKELFDRAFGKSAQTHVMDGDAVLMKPITGMTIMLDGSFNKSCDNTSN